MTSTAVYASEYAALARAIAPRIRAVPPQKWCEELRRLQEQDRTLATFVAAELYRDHGGWGCPRPR